MRPKVFRCFNQPFKIRISVPAAQITVSSQDHEHQKSMEEIANGIDESKVARRKEN